MSHVSHHSPPTNITTNLVARNVDTGSRRSVYKYDDAHSRLVSLECTFMKVLRILEGGGDMVVDSGSDAGSRSWRLQNEPRCCQEQSSPAQREGDSQSSQRAQEAAGSPWCRDRHNLSHRY